MPVTDMMTSADSMKFISTVESYYKKVSFHLPAGFVDFLVKIAPYMAVLGGVLGVIATPLMLMGLVLAPSIIINVIVVVVSTIISFMAFKPLKNRQMLGWVMMFWNQLFSVAGGLVIAVLGGGSNLVGALVGAVVGMYVLFEMRSRYSDTAGMKQVAA